jgi:hypothetical protein
MADSDSEDYVVVGTPLEIEEESNRYRKKVTVGRCTRLSQFHPC